MTNPARISSIGVSNLVPIIIRKSFVCEECGHEFTETTYTSDFMIGTDIILGRMFKLEKKCPKCGGEVRYVSESEKMCSSFKRIWEFLSDIFS